MIVGERKHNFVLDQMMKFLGLLNSSSNNLSKLLYDSWVRKIMAVSGNSTKLLPVEMKEALDCSRIHLVTRA